MDRELKRTEFMVLAVLRESPSHGYGIVQSIASMTDGAVEIRPGSLYRILDRMMSGGLLKRLDRRPAEPDTHAERRTYYGITPAGRRALRSEAELLSAVADKVIATSS